MQESYSDTTRHDSFAELLAESIIEELADIIPHTAFTRLSRAITKHAPQADAASTDGCVTTPQPKTLHQEILAYLLGMHPDSMETIGNRHGVTRACVDKKLQVLSRRLLTPITPHTSRAPEHHKAKAVQTTAIHADRRRIIARTSLSFNTITEPTHD